MIKKIYDEMEIAFNNKNYHRVVNIVNGAIKIPGFGFDRIILYRYGYSLLKTKKNRAGY